MSSSTLKSESRKLMRENAPKLFLIVIVYILVTTIMSELEFRLPGLSAAYAKMLEQILAGEYPSPFLLISNFRAFGAVLAMILLLLYPVVETGVNFYFLKISRGAGGDYADLLGGFLFFGKVIAIFLLSTLFTLLWSLLFYFPGLVAGYRYRQAYYILLDAPEKSALQCINESRVLMRGNKLNLFLIDLSFIGWILLHLLIVFLLPSPVSVPVVYIWLTPYMGLTRALYYRQLVSKFAA